jgi:long-chain acyl-CoA synthetase
VADSETIVGAVRRRAAAHPAKTALVAGAASLRYGELWERVEATAVRFLDAGLERRDRVLLAAATSPDFAVAYLATHLAGAVAVPVDPTAPSTRHALIAERSTPRLAVGVPAARELGVMPVEVAEGPSAPSSFSEPSADALADLLFTTGTTGFPKGVALTQRNVFHAASQINAVIQNGESDVEVVPLPLSHSFGLGRLRCNLLAGGTLVLTQGFRMPGEIFAALKTHAATGLAGVPAGFAVLLRFGARGLGAVAEQLRYVEIGSAAMSPEHKLSLMELLPRTRLFMHYGLTEASRSCFIEFHRDRDRLSSVGRPAPGVTVRIVDENGAPCPPATRGSLMIAGPHTASAYWNDAARSAQVFVDGWVKTDDVAEVDAGGFVTLHGRRDDMINVGGYNVSPDEVERILETHACVAEAACVGVPDPRGIAGSVVRAFLVARPEIAVPDDAELQRFTGERLEAYKVPSEYVWRPSLPRTSSGKLQRAELRAERPTK